MKVKVAIGDLATYQRKPCYHSSFLRILEWIDIDNVS